MQLTLLQRSFNQLAAGAVPVYPGTGGSTFLAATASGAAALCAPVCRTGACCVAASAFRPSPWQLNPPVPRFVQPTAPRCSALIKGLCYGELGHCHDVCGMCVEVPAAGTRCGCVCMHTTCMQTVLASVCLVVMCPPGVLPHCITLSKLTHQIEIQPDSANASSIGMV